MISVETGFHFLNAICGSKDHIIKNVGNYEKYLDFIILRNFV
jgi:hypothetical protein